MFKMNRLVKSAYSISSFCFINNNDGHGCRTMLYTCIYVELYHCDCTTDASTDQQQMFPIRTFICWYKPGKEQQGTILVYSKMNTNSQAGKLSSW